MKHLYFCSFVLVLMSFYAFNKIKKQDIDHKPKEGYVPNEETAVKIAEAIWLPIYGSKIYDQKPYKVKLIDKKIWIVEGTLKENFKDDGSIIIQKGGVAYIEIDKDDCKILKVTHGK